MAAVVSLMAKDKGTPAIRYQVLLWPVTDANFDTGSYEQFAEGHFLTRNMMKWFWDNYTTDSKQRAEIYASPLRATTEQLKGLPPALVQTAGADVLRDEGEAYARKLDQAGVPVTAVRYNGMIYENRVASVLSGNADETAATKKPDSMVGLFRVRRYITGLTRAVLISHGLCRNRLRGCRFRSCHRFR